MKKIYDFKSHKVSNFIFVMFNAVDSNIVYVYTSDDGKLKKLICSETSMWLYILQMYIV